MTTTISSSLKEDLFLFGMFLLLLAPCVYLWNGLALICGMVWVGVYIKGLYDTLSARPLYRATLGPKAVEILSVGLGGPKWRTYPYDRLSYRIENPVQAGVKAVTYHIYHQDYRIGAMHVRRLRWRSEDARRLVNRIQERSDVQVST